eukprot:Gb_39385 [translate_table: standard]
MSTNSSISFTEKYLKGEVPEAQMELGAPDAVLHAFGFEVELVSAACVSGRFTVTERCCQPFKVLHGGLSCLISEGLASMGAHIASGFQRIAGIELNINHLRAAALGEHVYAEAKPIVVDAEFGQVWEVKLWKISASMFASKIDTSTLPEKSVMAVSRVTFLSGLPVPPSASGAADAIKRKDFIIALEVRIKVLKTPKLDQSGKVQSWPVGH